MADINKYRDTKYLKQEDVDTPIIVTIDHCEEQNVAIQGQAAKIKCVIFFKEKIKPLVANWTNLSRIKNIVGSGDTDKWGGKKIVIEVDEEVEFGGNTVGGIRVREPKKKAKPEPEEVEVQAEEEAPPEDNSEVPF